MKKIAVILTALAAAATLAVAAPGGPSSMETQLAGIQLGKKADVVVKAYGSPRRIQLGYLIGPGLQFGWKAKVPGFMAITPDVAGSGGAGGGESGGGSSTTSMSYPGGPGGSPTGEGGEGGASAPVPLPDLTYWIYEQSREGVITVFAFDEDGRVASITVGDGFPDSVNRGGTRRPKTTAVTARGIKIGDGFGQLVRTYGHPERQIFWGDEMILTYYERFGVAFSIKQGISKITSITIRQM